MAISTDRTAAVELLREGEIVALPTETVYGLAADALNPIAVAKIFETKERPRFDPLIVHLQDREWLEKVVDLPAQDRQLIFKLADRFWPGPFTMVFPKREIVPEIVTAGLDTVAVRVSAHPVFSEIIRGFGKPLAAPSANRFGRISPTTAQHVLDDLKDQIPLIIDGGPTAHGVESTIVAICAGGIHILRCGPITEEQLSEFGKIDNVASAEEVSAPGQLPRHYAPKTPLRLIEDINSFVPNKNQRIGLLAWNPAESWKNFAAVRCLSGRQDLREAAANLFRYLRELDAEDVDLIVAEQVPDRGLGAAIMDRLRRAAHPPIDVQDTPE
ncbi:MAG TPA: L-threonylcarbamoyladenylate synthase [Candidatus Dormibacteraeota bacterium]|jgi:L-threonylcarbamoyladenylate synthase|nr:L-threonylcarbamoyladenylate synthase [Candidatus Dormibacteraeota bacterium]